ncbi:uncharacterized protein LOC142497031 isoform X2 [Ascaphus truei]|uniref:uncharacterized protein LOC142497031 isoform X2 n=1 Tax=Ascaphus truei TaxID=8439 RepID=UPI003F59AD7D
MRPPPRDGEGTEPPVISCICELCDCGRHRHHKDCRGRQRVQRRETHRDCHLSHYKATFSTPKYAPPRSSKRPLRTPAYPNPPAMIFDTTQRAEFIPRPRGDKTKPEEYYQSPREPMLDQTLYSLHYPPKEAERMMSIRPPDTLRPAHPSPRSHHSTTNRDLYREWKAERPPRYGELPSLTGSLLFPDHASEMKTTTQDHYQEKRGIRAEPARAAPGHLFMEGEHHMTTTHQSTFQPLPLENATGATVPVLNKVSKRPHMAITTKYQSDFPAPRCLPAPARPAHPPTDNLVVNPNFSNDFQTVQRETFHGWDVSQHPRPALTRLTEELSSIEKERGGLVNGDTVTKLAYRPPAVLPTEPLRRPRSVLQPLNAKFDGSTHSKVVFQDWGVQPRWRHGDPRDGISLRPLAKLDSETTTGSTFVSKRGERVRNYKPEKDSIELTGERDFCTVHRDTYRGHALPVCRLQTYLLQQRGERGPVKA